MYYAMLFCEIEYKKARGLTLLHNGQVQHRKLRGDNASPDSLSATFALSTAKSTEASISRLHEEVHTILRQDTLLHWEALLVLPSHDLEDVALELLQTKTKMLLPVSDC